eukprot:8729746-Ditylum_brightwellii.AAC.1
MGGSDDDDEQQQKVMNESKQDEITNPFYDVNVVGMLIDTIEAAEGEGGQHRKQQQYDENGQIKEKYKRTVHNSDKHTELVKKAMEVEMLYLNSKEDDLGLELVRGDKSRKAWGRIIRAPIKRRGH